MKLGSPAATSDVHLSHRERWTAAADGPIEPISIKP
jgi:hypothetical protein